MSEPSPFALSAPAILAHGYTPLPLIPKDKAPGQRVSGRWQLMAGWNKFRDEKPQAFIVKLWMQYEGAGIGVVLGTPAGAGYELGAVDIDTEDDMLLGQIESALPPSPVRKRGAKGYTAFYRMPAGTKGRNWRRGGRGLCDLLTGTATRQTVLPPSIHPTGIAYQWLTPQTLENTRPEDLPALLPDQVEKLCDTIDGLADASPEPRARSSHDAHDDNHWRTLNSVALERLDDWVPLLPLPKLAKKQGRWEAVASWRPSSTGRPLMQRKANLSIHRDGIKDFGTDQTYSPLDLLMASQNWPLDSAFQWLSERLGMAEESWLDENTDEPVLPLKPPFVPERVTEAIPQCLKWHTAAPENGKLPGLLGDITEWIMATARRPNPVLAMGAAVTVIGTLAGRRAAGPTLSGTHLYVIGLAGSGAGKDHPLQQITLLMEAAGAGHLIGPGKFMSETALVNMLVKKPLTLCPMDEFGVFLAKINHKRASSHEAGMSSFLREAWGRSFKTMITPEWGARPSERIESPSLSIYGVSTPDEFFASLTGQDVVNGFLNRFLMLDGNMKVSDSDPSRDPLKVPADLARDLADFYIGINKRGPDEVSNPFGPCSPSVIMSWEPKARAVWETMKDEIEPLADDADHGNFWKRTVEIAIRLASVRALGQGMAAIGADDIAWGRDLATSSALSMQMAADLHMAENERAGLRNRILRYIKKKENPVTVREIQQFVRSAVDSRTLKDILDQMVEAGSLKMTRPKPEINKPPPIARYTA